MNFIEISIPVATLVIVTYTLKRLNNIQGTIENNTNYNINKNK